MPGVRVGRHLEIPDAELKLTFTTSSGPGGQHVNKTATRVVLEWNVEGSQVLTDKQKRRIKRSLANRIDSSGVLRLASGEHRSQHRNREEVRNRLAQLVSKALEPRKKRLPTAPTPGSRQRRLEGKRRRSEIKKLRQTPGY
jgi:ribosome-associated protein